MFMVVVFFLNIIGLNRQNESKRNLKKCFAYNSEDDRLLQTPNRQLMQKLLFNNLNV